jgi:hypothetical protein
MWCVRVHFSIYSYALNDLRRKGLNKYRVVQYVFDFFTFFSKKKVRQFTSQTGNNVTADPVIRPSY